MPIVRRLLIIALFSLPSVAQLATMDQSCVIRQAWQSSGDSLAYTQNVVSGNLLVAHWHTRANVTTPTIADTRGSSWTLRVTQGSTNFWYYTWTALAGGSGADTVTVTESGGTITRIGLEEFSGCPEVIDNTATASPTISGGNITYPNITTSAYRDMVLYIMDGATTGSRIDQAATSYTYDIVSEYNATDAATVLIDYSADPGTFTGPTIGVAGSGSTSVGAIAFKMSSSLAVSTPAIPDAVSNVPYQFQLQAKGGAGTNVWSTTVGALPCGLSLSSGGLISGTPTCSNPNTITFQVTDSASATATKNLTLTVGTSASTISVVQSRTASLTYASNVTAGDLLVTIGGSTTAFGTSEFASQVITDTRGTVYSAIPGTFLSEKGAIIYCTFYWGIAPSSGANTVSAGTQFSSEFNSIFEFSNVQPIFDVGVVAKLTSNSGGSPITSGTISLPTTEALWGFAWPLTFTSVVISAGSGFTSDLNTTGGGNGGQFQLLDEYKLGATQGSQSATWGVTNNTSNIWSTMLLGLRPTVTGTAPVAAGNRKKSIL